MASLALGIVPSDEEVNAIKQQLKLLGHSLPTENNRRDPFPAPIPTEQKPACTEVTQAAAVRRDRHDQLMCTRDFLSRPLHSVLDAGHDQDRYALEHDFRTLNSELDDLAASLRHVSKPAPLHGQSSLMIQHRPQQRSEPASGMCKQPLGHLSGPITEGRQPLLDASLYSRDLPSRASHPHAVPNKNSFMPDGRSGGADTYRQHDATAESQHAQHDSQQQELQQVWNKDSFLRSGGTAKTSKRRGENFNELYAACHAAEDKLKELTLKHGKAAKGTLKGKGQQENVAPTDKRRDALRWETRMRMQLRDGYH
ncbi:MAG: hypothetical protein FRX49_03062 [Trebouxia sp. A1-2]|nr:MAG: hypothetical protein FRX49_03062 [Trebouxia sp. A1-2]